MMPRPSEHYPVAGRLGSRGRSLQAHCTGEFFVSSTLFDGGAGCYALVQESVYATADGKRIVAQAPLTSSPESEVRSEPACVRASVRMCVKSLSRGFLGENRGLQKFCHVTTY